MNEENRLDEDDHRRLGQELDLFVMSPLVGSGLPLFTPRGVILRDELAGYSNELREARGFRKVWTPHITKNDLYKASGHWDKFGNELFLVKSQETSDQMVLKPMNCPHHIQIYASRPRSYRELPIKFIETTTDYRDEKTGELQGLSRVRSLTQDDSHAFCREDQIEEIVEDLIDATKELYKTIGMGLKVRLSFKDDGPGYLGSDDLWQHAQAIMEEQAKKSGLEYFVGEGEAAFYGPKIDFMAQDVLGRSWQVATVQLDFVMPGRFKLEYVDEEGVGKTPVMVHCALLGSIERFLSVYIEHTAGRFPVWLAPEQLRIATLNQDDKIVAHANELCKQAIKAGLRAEVDDSNDTVGKKIRDAETAKVPFTVVIGNKEIENSHLTARSRSDLKELPSMQADELFAKISDLAKNRE
ncbi:MAG TPA: threonine--tRNA ligase [Candidatus Saccharimonadales bacterium]|nr:threonine--tRNA ligase [Candidatus Saccharimonadales bacterium]